MPDLILPEPHSPGQQELVDWNGSACVLCGRRWGKTIGGGLRLHRGCLEDPGLYWWVGLSWGAASMKKAWNFQSKLARLTWKALPTENQSPRLKRFIYQERFLRRSVHEIMLPGGTEVWFRTAENVAALAGEGLKGVVVDEYTLMDEEVWTEYLQPSLIDYQGWALLMGIPKGPNWASNMFNRAATREGWRQFRFSSYDNPNNSRAFLDALRDDYTEKLWAQEILAQIVSMTGGPFENVLERSIAEWQDRAIEGHQYVGGLDWGKTNDFTVFFVADLTTGQVVHGVRMNRMEYSGMIERVKKVNDLFRCKVVVADANGVGEKPTADLRDAGVKIIPFKQSNATKVKQVEALGWAFEKHPTFAIPKPTKMPVLVEELQAYTCKKSASGLYVYGPPRKGGIKDDCVDALLYTYAAMEKYRPINLKNRRPPATERIMAKHYAKLVENENERVAAAANRSHTHHPGGAGRSRIRRVAAGNPILRRRY